MQTHPLPIRSMPDFDFLPSEAISLELSQIEQALQISQGFPQPEQGWPAYLSGLAYLGFVQWLQRYAPDLSLQIAHSALQCGSDLAEPTIANLEIGPFRLCLIALTNPSTDLIYLPAAVVRDPEWLAHLYVIVQVQEEQAQVWVQSFLRYDQLHQHQQDTPLTPADGAYACPATWFNPHPHQLLLELQCLDPAAIPLPAVQMAPPDASMALLNHLMPVINLGNVWVQGMLDQLAAHLGWLMLPEPAWALRSPMLSPLEELDRLLVELQRRGTDILPTSQAIYKDFDLDTAGLRLYAVFADSSTTASEWKLLLILGSQSEQLLPSGTRLQVSDGTNLLVDQTLEQATDLSYLFCLVAGTWEERFWITIQMNELAVTLPPLAFQVES